MLPGYLKALYSFDPQSPHFGKGGRVDALWAMSFPKLSDSGSQRKMLYNVVYECYVQYVFTVFLLLFAMVSMSRSDAIYFCIVAVTISNKILRLIVMRLLL